MNIDEFVEEGPLQQAFKENNAGDYNVQLASTTNPDVLPGGDKAGEIWLEGDTKPQAVDNANALLKAVQAAQTAGKTIRAVYIPDAELGTRWFADKSIWVRDGAEFLPFTTPAAAQRYIAAHPSGAVVSYEQAVTEAK